MPRPTLTQETRAARRAEGKRRQARRKELGLTQAHVAEYIRRSRDGIGITAQMIGAMERGESHIPEDEPDEYPGLGISDIKLPSVETAWDAILDDEAEAEKFKADMAAGLAGDPKWAAEEKGWEWGAEQRERQASIRARRQLLR